MDFGALGFWIFIASLVVAGIWSESRREAEKHETLRRVLEKTGEIDEARMKELFKEGNSEVQKPGYAYRGLRITGVITLFIAAGVATFFLLAAGLAKFLAQPQMLVGMEGWIAGLAASGGIAMAGLGLFLSSRFATPPADSQSEPPAR